MVTAEAAEPKRKSKRDRRKRHGKLSEAQAVLGWLVILIMLAVLGAVYLFQTSRIASTGRKVQELQYYLDEVKRLNSELERDIAEAQSLTRIQREANDLGFVKAHPSDVEYLIVNDYPPLEATSEHYSYSSGRPYDEIGQEAYEKLATEFPEVDFSKIYRYEEEDLTTAAQELACMAGGCDII